MRKETVAVMQLLDVNARGPRWTWPVLLDSLSVSPTDR